MMLETLVMQHITSLKRSTLYFEINKSTEYGAFDNEKTAGIQNKIEEKKVTKVIFEADH